MTGSKTSLFSRRTRTLHFFFLRLLLELPPVLSERFRSSSSLKSSEETTCTITSFFFFFPLPWRRRRFSDLSAFFSFFSALSILVRYSLLATAECENKNNGRGTRRPSATDN